MDAASSHLARLGAISRPAGSVATDEARAYCADVLRALGFSVAERPFEYSKFPGAFAAPLAGAFVAAFAVVLFLARPLTATVAIGLLVVAAAVVFLFRYIGGRGVLHLSMARARGVNLEAVRGDASPTVWLVAHIDSKWQPVSMITRVLGVIGSAVGLVGLVVGSLLGSRYDPLAVTSVVIAIAGSVPLLLSVVGDRNHGTLDNASGVATVLEAAAMVSLGMHVGVLITDAEELALAGARAWAELHAPAIALNCDSVDDEGQLVAMYSSPRPAGVVEALEQAAREHAESLRVIRLIPGILTDHVALAGAGWATLTLSRGTARTLRRIHTARDTLASMRGTSIARAARVLAQTAVELS